jgi:outer membrane protein
MQELQENDQKIQTFQRQAKLDLDELRKNLTAPIYAKIQKAVEAVGNEEGITYIIDTSDNRVVFRGAGAIDVTAKVKAKLDAQQ